MESEKRKKKKKKERERETERKRKEKSETLGNNVHKEGMWHQLSNNGIMEGSKLRPNFLPKPFLFHKAIKIYIYIYI